jgi:hypothetical protein
VLDKYAIHRTLIALHGTTVGRSSKLSMHNPLDYSPQTLIEIVWWLSFTKMITLSFNEVELIYNMNAKHVTNLLLVGTNDNSVTNWVRVFDSSRDNMLCIFYNTNDKEL